MRGLPSRGRPPAENCHNPHAETCKNIQARPDYRPFGEYVKHKEAGKNEGAPAATGIRPSG